MVIYFSDDHGETFQLAETTPGGDGHPFAHMDESTLYRTGGEENEVVLNMRNDPKMWPNGSPGNTCLCRAIARSVDGGQTWGNVSFDPVLVDSICEASATTIGNTTVFFNPAMQV